MRWQKSIWLLVLFTGGMYLTTKYNHPLFFEINCTPDTAIVRLLMLSLTQLADGLWVGIVVMLMFPRRPGLVLAILVALLVAAVVTQTFKIAWPQPRPTVLFNELQGLCVPGYENRNSSFPSGHAVASLILARFLADGGGQLRYTIMLTLGVAMALSRVYVGVHFPADIWAGGWLGWFTAEAALRFFRHKHPITSYFWRGLLASATGVFLAFYFIFFHHERITQVEYLWVPMTWVVMTLFFVRAVYYLIQWLLDRSIKRNLPSIK